MIPDDRFYNDMLQLLFPKEPPELKAKPPFFPEIGLFYFSNIRPGFQIAWWQYFLVT